MGNELISNKISCKKLWKGKMHCINKNLVRGDIGTNEVPYKYVKPQKECDLRQSILTHWQG